MLEYSIGETIDKLAIINLKIWFTENAIKKAKDENKPAKEIEKLCDRVVDLNAYRLKIIKAINEYFEGDGSE